MVIKRILTVAGIGIVLAMTLATPASAHDIALYHEDDVGSVTRHNVVAVNDQECDNHAVVLQYYVSTIGGLVYYELWDSNGCWNSGSTRNHYPQQVTKARICEVNAGCSAWQYT